MLVFVMVSLRIFLYYIGAKKPVVFPTQKVHSTSKISWITAIFIAFSIYVRMQKKKNYDPMIQNIRC